MPHSDLIQSLARGLDILQLIGQSDQGMRLNEICTSMKLKAPTVHNLLRTLQSRQFIEKIEGTRYRLGPAMVTLVHTYHNRSFIQLATQMMQLLVHRYPTATFTLSEIIRDEILAVVRISPDQPGIVQHPRSHSFHLYGSATGLAIQAFTNKERLLFLRGRYPFYEFGAHLWQTPEHLDKHLAGIRGKGYALVPFKYEDFTRIAVPIFDSHHEVQAILGSSVHFENENNKTKQQHLDDVLQTAQKLSHEENGN